MSRPTRPIPTSSPIYNRRPTRADLQVRRPTRAIGLADDYRCPVCGRIGNGGALMYGLLEYGYICTGRPTYRSKNACVTRLRGTSSPQSLQFVMCERLEPSVVKLICDFYPRIQPDDYIAQTLSRAVLRQMRPQLPYKTMKIIANFIPRGNDEDDEDDWQ